MSSRSRRRSKFSAWALVGDHYDTLRNYQTGRRSAADYILYLGIPGGASAVGWLSDAQARNIPDVLAAVAILTGLIFSVFVLIFDLTARAADDLSEDNRVSAMRLADELRANVSYTVLVGLVLSTLLGGIAMFSDADQPLGPLPTALIIFLTSHVLLSIFMILKRTRGMFLALRLAERRRLP